MFPAGDGSAFGLRMKGLDPRKLWSRQFRVSFTTRAKFLAKAIEQIVDAYNRRALDDLKLHRRKMLFDIRMRSQDYDWSLLTSKLEEEIEVINAGFDRLQP
jgi:hypothetical protein